MATYVIKMVSLMAILSCITFTSAKVYTVGDSGGWALSVDYTAWTSDKTFLVGDSLCKILFHFYPCNKKIIDINDMSLSRFCFFNNFLTLSTCLGFPFCPYIMYFMSKEIDIIIW